MPPAPPPWSKCPFPKRGAAVRCVRAKLVYGERLFHGRLLIVPAVPTVPTVPMVPAVSIYAVSISSFFRNDNNDWNDWNHWNVLNNSLFLPRLPELQDPFLRFLLARAEFGIGIREPVLDTWSAALIRHHLPERDIIAQR